MAALKLTVICSLIVVAINAVFGTIIAWVLVRDEFPGKGAVNALIDLPFALPTIVAGLTLLTLYGSDSPIGLDVAFTRVAIVVALCFVTLPFVVRAVQPLLIEMDREMEEAATSLGAGGFTVFRRIIFPNLLPGILAGVLLAFARALGEYGSLILISGNIPFETEVSSVFIRSQIESGNVSGAAAVSVVLLAISLAAAGRGQPLRRAEAGPQMTSAKWGLRTLAFGYLGLLLLAPVGMIFYKTFEHGLGPPIDAMTSPDALHAIWLTLLMVAVAVPLNTVFGVGCALLLVRHRWKGNAVIDGIINLPFAISPIVIGLSLFLLYGNEGWFGPTLAEWGIQVLFSTPGMILASVFVSLPFVVREVGAGAAGDRHRAGAGGLDPRRQRLADLLAGHPAGDPLGRRLRRRADHRPRPRRVRRGDDRLRLDLGRDRDAAAVRRQGLRAVQRGSRLRGRDRARPARPDHAAADEHRRPQGQGRGRRADPDRRRRRASQRPTRRRVPDGNRSRGSAQALR